MKALTLTQPWATLVAIGAKRIETRSWGTRYRGPIAIHAAKGFPREVQIACTQEPFYAVLDRAGYWPRIPSAGDNRSLEMPRGAVLATARLVECISTDVTDSRLWPVGTLELAFGDFSPGRFAWLLEDVAPLPEPVAARGSLGLWEWAS